MLDTTLREVSRGEAEIPSGYVIYAIYDTDGRCCYVGMSKVARHRVWQHLSNTTAIGPMIRQGADLRIRFYTNEDVDALYLAEEGGDLSPTTNDKQWAESAEWYMCDKLLPYLNIRKGWPAELTKVRSFVQSAGLADLLEGFAANTLKKWNPPFDQQAILREFMNGANAAELAKLAGIESPYKKE